MVHITNGDSLAAEIRAWASQPRLIIWRDILHDGPAPEGVSHRELGRIRASWLSAEKYGPEAAVQAHFAERDHAMEMLSEQTDIWLWFEDDLYDQLQLLQILDWLHEMGLQSAQIYSVDVPRGVAAGELSQFAAAKRELGEAHLSLAAEAWRAFRSPQPNAWAGLLRRDTAALPHLGSAVRRLCEQYPSVANGLNRTERTALAATPGSRPDLFTAQSRAEERPWLGDAAFFRYLDALAPLLRGEQVLELTELGRAMMAGERDRIEAIGIDRWIGGVHLTAASHWRWDGATSSLKPSTT